MIGKITAELLKFLREQFEIGEIIEYSISYKESNLIRFVSEANKKTYYIKISEKK